MELNSADLNRIRETAYFKWLAAGAPCGDGVEYWLDAESEYLHHDDRIREEPAARTPNKVGSSSRVPAGRAARSLADEDELIGTRD